MIRHDLTCHDCLQPSPAPKAQPESMPAYVYAVKRRALCLVSPSRHTSACTTKFCAFLGGAAQLTQGLPAG